MQYGQHGPYKYIYESFTWGKNAQENTTVRAFAWNKMEMKQRYKINKDFKKLGGSSVLMFLVLYPLFLQDHQHSWSIHLPG